MSARFSKSRELREVGLREIDLRNTATAFFFNPDAEDMRLSVEEFGLLHPVYLATAHENGRLQPICGHRRLKACKQLGMDTIPAFIMRPGPRTRAECLLFNVLENSLHRSLNLVEISNVLFKLSLGDWQEERIIREGMARLGLASSKKIYRDYLSLQGLIPEFKAYLVRIDIPLRLAKRLAQWVGEDQRSLFSLIREFNPGANKLRGLLELLEEICLREKASPGKILGRKEISDVSQAIELAPADKARRIHALLRDQRYPALLKKRTAMDGEIKKLSFPKGVSLRYPENFEGEDLILSLRFSTAGELAAHLEAIQSECGEKNLAGMLKILRD